MGQLNAAALARPVKADPWHGEFSRLQDTVVNSLVQKFVDANPTCPASVVARYKLGCAAVVTGTVLCNHEQLVKLWNPATFEFLLLRQLSSGSTAYHALCF